MDFYAVWITESLEQRGAALDQFREIEGADDTYYNILWRRQPLHLLQRAYLSRNARWRDRRLIIAALSH